MATYVAPADVRAVLEPDGDGTQSTDLATAASMDDPSIQTAIDQAQSKVDGYCGSSYAVPFDDPVPDLVITVTTNIAAYLAELTFRKTRDFTSQLDPVYLRYADAMKTLQAIAAGTIVLPVTGGDGDEPRRGHTVVNQYQGRMYQPSDFRLGYSNYTDRWGTRRRGH